MQTSAAAFNHKKKLNQNDNRAKVLADALSGMMPNQDDPGQGLRISAENLPAYSGSKVPATLNSPPTNPAPAPAPAPGDFLTDITSRYQPMQNNIPKPERDAELEEKMKRRAKMNLISRGIGSLGQMAGVAAGGDAVRLEDGVSPWIQNQLLTADQDYRSNVQNWIEKGFQVDMYNNKLQNQERSEDYDTGVRQDQAAQKAQYDAQLAEQRAQAALNQLKAKSTIDQRKEMQKLGINPDDPKALEQFLDLNRKKFGADLNLTKARTNWNNRLASGSGKGANGKTFDLETMRKGRDAMVKDIQNQIKGLDSIEDAEQLKILNDRMKSIQNYNPGSNELLDDDIMRRGAQLGAAEKNVDTRQWDPDYYMANVPKINVKAQESIQMGVQKIMSPEFRNMNQMAQGEVYNQIIQGLLEGGYVNSEEEAEQYLLEILGEDDN